MEMDMTLLFGPIVFGFGSSALLTPKEYRRCGVATNRPQPPAYVFAIAWTILYVLLGIAALLAYKHAGRKFSRGLTTLTVTFFLLCLWWVVFANFCIPVLAFATIAMLAGLAFASVVMLWIDGAVASAALTIPLVLWLMFATYLVAF